MKKLFEEMQNLTCETIEIEGENQYKFVHGLKPKGMGGWAFIINHDEANPVFVPAMNYSDAKIWIKNYIKQNYPNWSHYDTVVVGT